MRIIHNLYIRLRKLLRHLFNHEQRLIYRNIWDTASQKKLKLISTFSASLLTILFEGNTMALLSLSVIILIDGNASGLSQLPEVVRHFFESLEQNYSIETIFVIIIILGTLSEFFRSLLLFLNQILASQIAVFFETTFQSRLYKQYNAISYYQFSKYKLGDISMSIHYATDISQLAIHINNALVAIITTLVYGLLLLWISPTLLLVAVFMVLPIWILMRWVITYIRKSFTEAFAVRVQLYDTLTEFFSGSYVIRTSGRTDYAEYLADKTIMESEKKLKRGYFWYSLSAPLFESTSIIIISLFLVFVVFILPDDLVDMSSILAFLVVLWRTSRQVGRVNGAIAFIGRQWALVKKVMGILRTDDKEYLPDGEVTFNTLEDGITLQNITLSYNEEDPPALKDVSIKIPKGKFIALVGESGSGKSSVVSLLARLYDPNSGELLVDTINLKDLKLDTFRKKIGLVGQDTFIFHDTIMNNIRFGNLEASDEDVIQAAKSANAHNFIQELSHGYQTIVGERGMRLSGGQRQRIALARALVRQTEILILDEATSALDSESEQVIQESLRNLYGQHTILAVAHRLSTISEADNIIVLDHGKIIESGTHDELLVMGQTYAKLWNLQTRV